MRDILDLRMAVFHFFRRSAGGAILFLPEDIVDWWNWWFWCIWCFWWLFLIFFTFFPTDRPPARSPATDCGYLCLCSKNSSKLTINGSKLTIKEVFRAN